MHLGMVAASKTHVLHFLWALPVEDFWRVYGPNALKNQNSINKMNIFDWHEDTKTFFSDCRPSASAFSKAVWNICYGMSLICAEFEVLGLGFYTGKGVIVHE